jgi:DNA-binding NarL/FixJ family response regulator
MPKQSPASIRTKDKTNHAPRVAIAEDHALFQKIYEITFESAGMEVVCMASNGDRAIKEILQHQPDIVIMDIAMPEMDGLAALSVLKYMAPEVPVLVISHMTDSTYATRALELGAAGFLSKGVSSTELILSIQTIIAGKSLPIVVNEMPEPAAPSVPGFTFPRESLSDPLEEAFTDQERLILSLIAVGKTNQSILESLHISKNTLKTHTRNIYSKIGVKDRTQAAIWGVQHGYGVTAPSAN